MIDDMMILMIVGFAAIAVLSIWSALQNGKVNSHRSMTVGSDNDSFANSSYGYHADSREKHTPDTGPDFNFAAFSDGKSNVWVSENLSETN